MKSSIYAMLMACVFSTVGAKAENSIQITIKKPIRVNKTDLEGYSGESAQMLSAINDRLLPNDDSIYIGTTEFDYAYRGKIFTLKDFMRMSAKQITAVLKGSLCRINSEVYVIEKEWSWSEFSKVVTSVTLQGKFKAETVFPSAVNNGTFISVDNNGVGTVWQNLGREYRLVDQSGKTAYVSCTTVLNSTSVEEGQAKLNAYNADDFGPLKAALGL